MGRGEKATRPARPRPRVGGVNGANAVLARIAAMPAPYRAIGRRLHALVMATAPGLTPKVWYGMPAYASDGRCVCFFRGAKGERYVTFGFTEAAGLDEGTLWPTAFAIRALTAGDEARIAALARKAVS
jgi:hypothetical protein